jgi:hypothetical protein
MINHQIALDMRKRPGTVPQRVTVRRGETQTQKITASLTVDGATYTPTCQLARLCVLHADGTWARCSATVGTGTVSVTLPPQAVNGAGRCRLAYFEFCGTGSETTEDFALVILGSVDGSGGQSEDYDNELDALKREWASLNAAVTSATKRAESAASSAEGNADAANRAASAATAAAKQANAAAAATKPYYMQSGEPPRDKRVDGGLWMQTNEGTHKIASFKRWDANLPGKAVFPGASTMPGTSTIIDEIGAWTTFTL